MMDFVIFGIIAAAAVLGTLAATDRIMARKRFETKLDRIIELLERGGSAR